MLLRIGMQNQRPYGRGSWVADSTKIHFNVRHYFEDGTSTEMMCTTLRVKNNDKKNSQLNIKHII